MKKLFNAIVLVLAFNFLAVAGGVGWLFQSGKLDQERFAAIKAMLFPPAQPVEVVSTQPATQPTPTEPSVIKLDELLAKYAGRRTGEQVEMIQESIDAQAVALDRRSRELNDLMQQILREKEDLARKTSALESDRQQLGEQEKKQLADASDKGFQDSLKLFMAMAGKQAKSAFMELPDETVARYLQSMPPRSATKIIKEFKTPAEQARINLVLDRMRQGGGPPASQPTAGGEPADGVSTNGPAGIATGVADGRAPAAPLKE